MRDWISVKEGLPDSGQCVLVYDEVSKEVLMAGFEGEDFDGFDFVNEHGEAITDGVTHWMPLPEPPKEDE